MRTPHRREAGLTLIELMVSMVVAAIAVGFMFRIYATTSVAYRSQSQIAEVQQTLRTAKQTIESDLRMAGYFASGFIATGAGGTLTPVTVTNSNNGPDQIAVVWSDTSCFAKVHADEGPNHNASVTQVTRNDCFNEGDIIMAVRTKDITCPGPPVRFIPRGTACTLYANKVNDAGDKHFLQHNPGLGAPWNGPSNDQCKDLDCVWDDGNTAFLRYQARAYRIKPADNRGVLQVSQSGGVLNDWEDVALGVVDMQFALLTYKKDDAVDEDQLPGPDGAMSPEFDWYSGENMEADDLIDPAAKHNVVAVRLTLVARTTAEIEGVFTETTPSMLGDKTKPENNPVGDRDSVVISKLEKTSPYAGQYAFRSVSTVIDLRNLGVGLEQ